MNLFSFAFVDTTLFQATMTLKYGRHFADNDRPAVLAEFPFQDAKHIVLRGPADNADANWFSDVDQIDYPLLKEWPSARQLIENINAKVSEHLGGQNITFGKVYLESLAPGGAIGWHADESPYAKHYARFRLLVSACAGGCWFSGGETLAPGTGNLTFFNHQLLHSIINLGPVPQISLVIDARKPALQ